MIKITVNGACGRMGSTIIANLIEQPDMKLVGALEAEGHPLLGADAGEAAHLKKLGVKVSADPESVIKACDAVIDFSSPDIAVECLRCAEKNKKAAVVGTTGFSSAALQEIGEIAREIAIVLSPNMSVGVNLLFGLVRKISPLLTDYDIEIIEAHHKMKKDAPSGTALKFAQIIADSLNRDVKKDAVFGRKGITGERKPCEIGIHAVRGGDTVGEHTIVFAGKGERIELVHRASSRDTFALGAIKAARFAVGSPPGLYDMEAVLGLK